MLSETDIIGFAAAASSLVAVSSTRIVCIWCAMIASNILFIAWAIKGVLLPPLMLHAVLLPINLWRLWQLLGCRKPPRALRVVLPRGSLGGFRLNGGAGGG